MGLLDGGLAQSVYSAFKGKLLPGVIRRAVTPESGGLDARGDPIDVAYIEYPIEGFIEGYSDFLKGRDGIPETDAKVNFFAKSAPGFIPGKDDQARIGPAGSQWYQLRQAGTDPATALWTCRSFQIADPGE